ncbi:MAG: bifunctional adenosylcobinamide kinase/adenosylcobinamide-phosphate guanylyltransferase [Dissulfurispiraceae bacterium]|jgi:adenosylcobinamide kinase/adenosylcobinamide-phosphate guanylyltransferase
MGNVKGKIFFILGGARSGKSRFALEAASGNPGTKAYIATALALDAEMEQRIARHKAERSTEWHLFEEPVHLGDLIARIQETYDVLLIDCLTLWITNLMLGNDDVEGKARALIDALSSCRSSVFIVSNEVGLGIVPDNRMAREFRDIAGMLNQQIAATADEVYFLAAGLPIKIK